MTGTDGGSGGLIDRVAARCGALASLPAFQNVILGVIVLNAVVIGFETYPSLEAEWGPAFERLNRAFLGIFVVELVVRLAAYGRQPWRFFRRGWNIFDFTIIAATFVPVIGANATALRILRVLRVVRIVEKSPDLRVIVRGVLRSMAPLAGVGGLVVIITYIYAVIGNALFGEQLPDDWGDVGAAMLSCFQILTLDNWDDLFFPALEVSALTVPYFLSYILVATFVVLNIVIAVVVNSVESARRADLEADAAELAREVGEEAPELAERILAMRLALDELESQLQSRALTRREGGEGRDPS